MAIFTYFLPVEGLDRKVMIFLDTLAAFHIALFICVAVYFCKEMRKPSH